MTEELTEAGQQQEDQLDLYHSVGDPKRYAEVSARIKERKMKEEEARHPKPVAPKPKPKPVVVPRPKNAGVLVRVSTEDQSRHGYSKQDQLTWARSEASRLGLRLIEYVEEGGAHSDMLDRDALNDLEEDIVAGKIGTLLLRYGDRLGRGAVFTKLLEWLKAWKVVIRCGDMPDAGDATDTLMSFYGSQGSQFLKTLRSRTKDGVRNAQAAGKHVGGQLLGFRWETGAWEPEDVALRLESGNDGAEIAPWQRQRILQALRAYRAGPEAFAALLEKRRSSSRDRHMAARRRQEERNNTREGWLLAHRPISVERIAL